MNLSFNSLSGNRSSNNHLRVVSAMRPPVSSNTVPSLRTRYSSPSCCGLFGTNIRLATSFPLRTLPKPYILAEIPLVGVVTVALLVTITVSNLIHKSRSSWIGNLLSNNHLSPPSTFRSFSFRNVPSSCS